MTDATAAKPLALRIVEIFGLIAGWGWGFVCIVGGIGLLITRGPWPLTNGWFALFSGLAACPATAWIIRRLTGKQVSGWVQFALAFLIILAGRTALVIEGRGTLLPSLHN
jgi:hypothetical protein